MFFINLTPHAIHLPDRTIETSGSVARCEEITTKIGTIDGVDIVTKNYGRVEELPEPRAGYAYIVSMMVRMAADLRGDIYSPGDLIRDEKGNITGCKNLVGNVD